MRSLGYATFRYKLVCFVIAGALAGLSGYLAAAQHGNVNPDMMGWHLSGGGLMMVILGGMGTLTGPIVGAFAMLMLEIAFQGMTKHWQLLMGGFIVLVALFLPRGLIGVAAALRREWTQARDAGALASPFRLLGRLCGSRTLPRKSTRARAA
jgi:branched-chain amino acid transport system permease protein